MGLCIRGMGVRDVLLGALIGASLVVVAFVPMLSTGMSDPAPHEVPTAPPSLPGGNGRGAPCPCKEEGTLLSARGGGNASSLGGDGHVDDEEAMSRKWRDHLSAPPPAPVRKFGPCVVPSKIPSDVSDGGIGSSAAVRAASRTDEASSLMLALYDEMPGTDYNQNFGDIGKGLEFLPEGLNGTKICVEQCEATPCCGAVVIRSRTCYLKRTPGALEVRGAPTVTSFVRRDMTLQYVRQKGFEARIAFGMLAAPKYLFSRASAALSTWLCDYSVVLLVEAADGAEDTFRLMVGSLPAACRAGKVATFRSPPDTSHGGAWKDLPMARLLLTTFPGRDWYSIIDDDTFVIMHNLNLELSTFYNKSDEVCIGAIFMHLDGPEKPFPFPQGGAGILLSHSALSKISAMRFTCMDHCKHWAGDVRMGCCVRLASVRLAGSANLWSRTPFLSVGVDKRHHSSAYPVSFHQMRDPKWVRDVFAFTQAATSNMSLSCGMGGIAAQRHMCSVWRRQRLTCTASQLLESAQHAATANAQPCDAINNKDAAKELAAPFSWDAMIEYLRRDGAYDPSFFIEEQKGGKIW